MNMNASVLVSGADCVLGMVEIEVERIEGTRAQLVRYLPRAIHIGVVGI